MRRTTLAVAGLTAVISLGSLPVALTVAGGHHAAPARSAAPPPALPTISDGGQAATLQANVLPVPATTQLAAPKYSGMAYFDAPNGRVAGALPVSTWGGATVRPVVSEQLGWLELRLDSRPNASTGWVKAEDVMLSTTSYRIVVSVGQRNLTLLQNGAAIYSAPVGVGKPQWPTPLGPSFVDALIPVPRRLLRVYGPLVIITGSHSNVFTEFDGGDGTVGIHGYPSDPASTAGVASSHGCIRANRQTMAMLGQVPLGTPIDITA